jgi:GAF domain
MERFKDWSPSQRIAGISIGTVVVFLLTAAIAGIVGNRADTLFIWLWGLLTQKGSWPWIIIFMILIIGFGLVLYSGSRNTEGIKTELQKAQTDLQKVNIALDRMNMLIGLDDSLLRLLASWMPAKEREREMKLLLADLLRDATTAFAGDVHRAIVFLPDASGEHLRTWAHYQIPQETIIRSVFYVGKDGDDRRRGLAGETFLEIKLHVARILHKNDHWKCDSESYIDFDKRRPFPPYRSLVCVPIIGLAPNSPEVSTTTCLGVVCFDSQNPTIFDNPGAQYLLQVFSRRIAAALLIYQQFPKLDDE